MYSALFEDIRNFLPKYLSPESQNKLFSELKNFPDNIDKRMFTEAGESDKIYQGDAIDNLLIFNLPSKKVAESGALILSNTCDIDIENDRKFLSPSICYSPIINLTKYKKAIELKSKGNYQIVDEHINNIRRQRITQIFYLPKYSTLDESIILFDKIISVNNNTIERENLKARRLFRLSNYGFYLFIFKLSMHFTRMNETIDRES